MLGIIWVLFGNDDDGIYGTEKWRANRNPSAWVAFLWWLRNPFHNLFWHVLNFSNGKDQDIWPEAFGFKGRWSPPLLAYRGKYIECYFGFRGKQGVLGACFRRSKSPGA